MSNYIEEKADISRIPLLKGDENYLEWATSIINTLDANGAWDIIEGRHLKPEEPPYL